MIHYFNNLIRQFGLFLSFAYNVKIQKKFMKQQLDTIISQSKKNNDDGSKT